MHNYPVSMLIRIRGPLLGNHSFSGVLVSALRFFYIVPRCLLESSYFAKGSDLCDIFFVFNERIWMVYGGSTSADQTSKRMLSKRIGRVFVIPAQQWTLRPSIENLFCKGENLRQTTALVIVLVLA